MFDIQSLNFTYNSLSKGQFVKVKKKKKKKKSRRRLKFGTKIVNAIARSAVTLCTRYASLIDLFLDKRW